MTSAQIMDARIDWYFLRRRIRRQVERGRPFPLVRR